VIDRLRALKAGHIDGMPGTGAVLSFGVGAVEVELLNASRLMFGGFRGHGDAGDSHRTNALQQFRQLSEVLDTLPRTPSDARI